MNPVTLVITIVVIYFIFLILTILVLAGTLKWLGILNLIKNYTNKLKDKIEEINKEEKVK